MSVRVRVDWKAIGSEARCMASVEAGGGTAAIIKVENHISIHFKGHMTKTLI